MKVLMDFSSRERQVNVCIHFKNTFTTFCDGSDRTMTRPSEGYSQIEKKYFIYLKTAILGEVVLKSEREKAQTGEGWKIRGLDR